MTDIGKLNTMKVVRKIDYGLLLDGEELGEILIPNRYVDKEWKIGDEVEVFIMCDSEDRLTAITTHPTAMVDQCACLRVLSTTAIGAFLDWGLPKDLFVPKGEQKVRMQEGHFYVVYIYLDRTTNRIAASSKLHKYIDQTEANYAKEEEVHLMVHAKTDMGYKVIINHQHSGMLFSEDVFQPLKSGRVRTGYIKKIRPDGKLDVCLHKPGYEKVTGLAQTILTYLKEHDGSMNVTDKSSPEDIYALFGVSKKTLKKSLGALYKKRLITFDNEGTRISEGS